MMSMIESAVEEMDIKKHPEDRYK